MRRVIIIKLLLKSLIVAVILAAALSVSCPVFAEQPPYGMVFGDTWAVEGLDEVATYSFSPIPTYRKDTATGPTLILAQGTTFEFYYDLDVEITKLVEWDMMGRYSGDGPAVYENFGSGSYTFNEPGYYVIFFVPGTALPVEVVGRATQISQPAAAANEVKVTLDGKLLSFDVPPQIINDRTLVPLRVIFEALGASVEWNDSTQTVTAARGNTTVSLQIGSNVLTKNGSPITLDVPAQLINDRTMVPARAVAEAFDAKVDWIDATQTVVITGSLAADIPPSNDKPTGRTKPGSNTADSSAYDDIIGYYRDLKLNNTDVSEALERFADRLSGKLGITNEQELYEITCSAFEAYDTYNLGYALHDINGDGVSELIIITDKAYDYSDFIYAIYTLRNGSPVLVSAHWSRYLCSLDKYGTIYTMGSNGADDSFAASYSLNPDSGKLQLIREVDFSEFPDSPTKDAGLVFISLS